MKAQEIKQITTKKVNNKRIIVQNESPKQYEEFKGSRYTKMIKTEIENDQVTNIESNDNLHMESQPEGDEMMYGPKDFYYNVKSEIKESELLVTMRVNLDEERDEQVADLKTKQTRGSELSADE